MNISDFWDRMNATFGETYARSVASDQEFSSLDGRTIEEALSSGRDIKAIWKVVCVAYPDRVPSRLIR